MIRLAHALWLALPVAAGVGLFHLKFEVQALEERLSGLHTRIRQDQEAIHVLRAEWSYLNEPGRLAGLARRHLELTPVLATQLAGFDDLPARLPGEATANPPPAPARGTADGDGQMPAGPALSVSAQTAIGMEGAQ